jgi:hypothetical protein
MEEEEDGGSRRSNQDIDEQYVFLQQMDFWRDKDD